MPTSTRTPRMPRLLRRASRTGGCRCTGRPTPPERGGLHGAGAAATPSPRSLRMGVGALLRAYAHTSIAWPRRRLPRLGRCGRSLTSSTDWQSLWGIGYRPPCMPRHTVGSLLRAQAAGPPPPLPHRCSCWGWRTQICDIIADAAHQQFTGWRQLLLWGAWSVGVDTSPSQLLPLSLSSIVARAREDRVYE